MQSTNFLYEIESSLMTDERPSHRLKTLSEQPWFRQAPFEVLLKQKKTEQSPVHHPEGSVWNHTLMVVDEAAQRKQHSKDPRALMWGALLHDIGKPATTKLRKGRITAYNHDSVGAKLAQQFILALTQEAAFAECVKWLVEYHMQPLYVLKSLPFADIAGMKRHCDTQEIALLSYCDRLGRLGADLEEERCATALFLKKCSERTDLSWLKQV